MKMIQEDLEEPTKTIWFDAWKYEKSEVQWAALIQSILSTIENDENIVKWGKIKAKKITTKRTQRAKRVLKKCSKVAKNLGRIVAEGVLKKVNVEAKLDDLLPEEKKISTLEEKSEFQKEIEFLTHLQKEFKEILEDYIVDNGKLVIFIDDLDRCLPEKAIDVLEAMKNYLDTKGCVFIVGVDNEAIKKGIEAKYGGRIGIEDYLKKDYIEKIIQLPFRLPPLGTNDAKEYLKDYLKSFDFEEIEEIADIITLGVELNPRKIKRFVNMLKLQRILIEKRRLDITDEILVKNSVLQYSWPRFYEDLRVYKKSLIKEMREFIEKIKTKGISIPELDEELKILCEKFSIWKIHFENRSLIQFLKSTDFLHILEDLTEEQFDHLFTLSGIVTEIKEKFEIKGVDEYIQDLKSNLEGVKGVAAMQLGSKKDSRAVEPLIETLKDKDYNIRGYAVRSLGNIGDPRAVEPLIETLKDENSYVRSSAVEALGKIDDPRAIESLIKTLKDDDEFVKHSVIQAFGKIKDKRTVKPLIETLKDESYKSRGSVAWALGEIGDIRTVKPLIDALKDKSSDVRMSAAKALGKIDDLRAVEPLIKALKDEESFVIGNVAEALGKIGDTKAVKPLIDTLKDEAPDNRIHAGRALGLIGDKRAVVPLIKVLKDESNFVRRTAAQALGKIGDRSAVEPLIKILKDENSQVRVSVAKALGDICDPSTVEPLIETLKDENPYVRGSAIDSLRKIGDFKAIKPLNILIENTKNSEDRHRIGSLAKEAIEEIKSRNK